MILILKIVCDTLYLTYNYRCKIFISYVCNIQHLIILNIYVKTAGFRVQ